MAPKPTLLKHIFFKLLKSCLKSIQKNTIAVTLSSKKGFDTPPRRGSLTMIMSIFFKLLLSICLISAVCNILSAQPYTQTSKRFFTNTEIDELVYKAAKEVFEYNKVPETVLKNNFQNIEPILLAEIKPGIVKQFKIIEFYNENGIASPSGSKPYKSVKEQYTKYFKREVDQAFLRNKKLRNYISFNTSDRITYFKSDVTVQKNGALLVTETISIYNGDGENGPNETAFADANSGSKNDQIKRGITRTFPTMYVGDYKLFYNTTFKVINVKRNDNPAEQWRVKKQANGEILFIGNPSYFLPNGFYTYTITYETEHQLKHLDHEDQLAWNVTGNGWDFRIDSASCTIHLPNGARGTDVACATGLQGSTAKDCNYTLQETSNSLDIHFKTTRPLLPNEGMSSRISFTKGIVAAPSFLSNAGWLFMSNKPLFIMMLLILLIAVYYCIAWQRVGKDPLPGNIIPEFYPPSDLSPAAMGYIYFQEWDNKMVAATIVDLAVKKVIVIDVAKEGFIFKHNAYTIKAGSMPSATSAYYNFSSEGSVLTGEKISKGSYNAALLRFSNDLRKYVEAAYRIDADNNKEKKGFFSLNNKYTTAPIVISSIAFIGCFIWASLDAKINPWSMAWMFGCIVPLVIVHTFFGKILSAYNQVGRKVKDAIEGFKMYLTAADEQRLNVMNPPDKTPELYEKYLPFAIALNCEVAWGKKFENIIDSATIQPSSGVYTSLGSNRFSSSFVSSFSGSIASASTPPSSSGSSSGGGFSSGSGGGGGGGGGW